MNRDPASDQLVNWKKSAKTPPTLLTGYGAPIANKNANLSVGPRGPLLLQDSVFLDEIRHFTREKIPERVVHAKGTGAYGYFEVTHDISKYTKLKPFSSIGKRTPLFVRFSQGVAESGVNDLVLDIRGFATKWYTEDGIWDLVMSNMAVNFVRDPMLFPSFAHSQKRNPVTNLKDSDSFWDFLSLRPETTHATTIIFSDRGIPDGYRHMDGFGQHAFKLVNDKNEIFYAKFHCKTNQKIKNFSLDQANKINAQEPDYSIRDLYNAIARGDYPSWTLYIQIMTPQQTRTFPFNPFDITKVWSHKDFPLIPIGKLVLDKNPENYFKEVEQAAFNPAHMIPGIEASPGDLILQSRIFIYTETQRYRAGTNHLQLAVNCPFKFNQAVNYQIEGPMAYLNQDGSPTYYPNSFNGPVEVPEVKSPSYYLNGEVSRHEQTNDDNDYAQVRIFWREVLPADEKTRLIKHMASNMKKASVFIIERALKNFTNVDQEFGRRLIDELRRSGVPINASGMSANL